MKLYFDKRLSDPTYYAQQGFRNGKKTTTKNIFKIGKHSELLKITPDPQAYARKVIADYNEQLKGSKATMEVTIDFAEKLYHSPSPASSSNLRNIGYFFLQQIIHDLSLHSFFNTVTSGRKFTFDPYQVHRFLTFSRILDPDSKFGTYEKLSSYYEQPDFSYQHILRTMDILADNYDSYISHLFQYSNNIVPRDTSVCYFDCTNFYFETEHADADFVDEVTGEIIKGFRKYGPSKEHRPNPLVEMGLFIDANGIPLSMCIASGSDNEQTLALPEEKKLSAMLKKKKFIYCADAGLGSLNIRKFNSMGGRAFIVTQSVKKLPDILKQAVFNDYGYKLLSSDKPVLIKDLTNMDIHSAANFSFYNDKAYKVLDYNAVVPLGFTETKKSGNGQSYSTSAKGFIKQKVIITFSRKMQEYQRAVRNAQINRAKILLEHINPETYKKGPHDITRFIKRISSPKPELHKELFEINKAMIAEEEKYDGYYAVATNLDDDAKTIIDISSRRYKIEDCFRVLKSNLSGRPVYHYEKRRIIAHFLICFTALLVYRLLENKLNKTGRHLTIEQILETLRNMQVANIQDMYYMATFNGSDALSGLNEVYPLNLDKKYYQPKELNKIIKKIY